MQNISWKPAFIVVPETILDCWFLIVTSEGVSTVPGTCQLKKKNTFLRTCAPVNRFLRRKNTTCLFTISQLPGAGFECGRFVACLRMGRIHGESCGEKKLTEQQTP